MTSLWVSNIDCHKSTIASFSNVLGYRAQEANTISLKIDYAQELMANADKQNDKIATKKQKYLNEKSIEKWENIDLTSTFGDEKIIQVLQSYKVFC